ncbi:MAG TPA: PAS domain S-box protein [Deltaproteobacteria bacterium]|nr:PAS domain S-box protein [Deltaproteobacteria bacterium]HOI06654.1 PAS domain S-box protein [Deltaproteobacteria bacterium]
MGDKRDTAQGLQQDLEEARRRIGELEVALARQKAIEADLREGEENYRFHFLLANDIMFSYNDQFKVLSVSPNVERVLGYRPEEFIGKSFHEAGVLDPACMTTAVTNALKALSGQTVHGSVYRFITRDGTMKFGEVSGVPIVHGGRVVKVVAVSRDITARIEMENSLRRSEERYRTTLESMPDAVCILTTGDCRFLYVNQAFTKITGFSADETVGKPILELDLAENPKDMEDFIDLIRKAQPVDSLECRCRSRGGDVLDAFVSARPVDYDGQGCMVVVMTDVTALKRVEEEKRLIEVSAQKFEALGTLAKGIAHDFNNILTTIIGYTKMTLKDLAAKAGPAGDFSSVRSDLGEVRRSALRARDLVNQILAFSRHMEKAPVPLELGAAVEDSLKIVTSILPRTVEIRTDLSLKGAIMGDPGQIHQVVMNLCTNAAHAMKDGQGVLELGLRRVDAGEDRPAGLDLPPGSCLMLTVSDTGSGMSRRTLDRIFDPYFTTRDREHGAGLGLAVVQGIVRNHRGGILCRSTPGQGTVFEIYFPEVETDSTRTVVTRMPRPRTGTPPEPAVPRDEAGENAREPREH